MRALAIALICLGLSLGPTSADGYRVSSETGAYQLELEPEAQAVRLGNLHSWQLILRDAEGRTVDGATLTVNGGMPLHGHGLPTNPLVSNADGSGTYRIEGLRFNMPGRWELRLKIDGAAGHDTALLEIQL